MDDQMTKGIVLIILLLSIQASAFPLGVTHWACCFGVIGGEIAATTLATGGVGLIADVVLGSAVGAECMATGFAQFWWAGMVPMPVCVWTFAIPPPG